MDAEHSHRSDRRDNQRKRQGRKEEEMKKTNFETILRKLDDAPIKTFRRFIDREALRLFCETKNEMVKIEALKLLEKGIDR